MKIINATQTREADAYTIREEAITSADLMERAAKAFAGWFENKFTPSESVHIFCGPGNNGGDGLVVARLLNQRGYQVEVYTVGNLDKASNDFQLNFKRLPEDITLHTIQEASDLPILPAKICVIDALFGTGLNRPVTGLYAQVIQAINNHNCTVTSIDIPSGLYTDSQTPAEGSIIQSDFTVSFELPKLAFFLPQHEEYVGEWHVVPIGLSEKYISKLEAKHFFLTPDEVAQLIRPRKNFSHKGLYGHALLLCGGFGKIGAAVLAAQACLRSGIGLLTTQVPSAGYPVMQTAVTEAMTLADKNRKHLSELPASIEKFNTIGIGPGIGTERITSSTVGQLLATAKVPLVIDADAINIISKSDKLKNYIKRNQCIFTPHPKEFERLVGKSSNNYERLSQLVDFCQTHNCYIILKGNNSVVATPEGKLYFNTTGNPGMATGGTGDALTGIVTALVAQEYSLEEACLLGVYVHGLAGDLAVSSVGEISMIASDLIEHLPKAFMQLVQNR